MRSLLACILVVLFSICTDGGGEQNSQTNLHIFGGGEQSTLPYSIPGGGEQRLLGGGEQ